MLRALSVSRSWSESWDALSWRQFFVRCPSFQHSQHKRSLTGSSFGAALVGRFWRCPTFSISCCIDFMRVFKAFSVRFMTSFSFLSSIWQMLVLPHSFPALICKYSFPTLTVSFRVWVGKASKCLCRGKYPNVLQKVTSLISVLCSGGRSP